MKFSFGYGLLIGSGLILGLVCGCRQIEDDPPPDGEVIVEGNYVGIGNLGGGPTNVLVQIVGPDSTGRVTGEIRYRGAITGFDLVMWNSTHDTLQFRYQRQGTTFSGWALTGALSLLVHYAEPDGIPEFRVNKEVNGVNLTGIWQGYMYSEVLNDWRSATMTMDQHGQLFFGDVDVTLLHSADFQLNSGIASGSEYQLNGQVRILSIDYPAWFGGYFATYDSLRGDWQAGAQGSVDYGIYEFRRGFE